MISGLLLTVVRSVLDATTSCVLELNSSSSSIGGSIVVCCALLC